MTVVVGVDVAKTSVTACALTEVPGNLKRASQKYRSVKLSANRDGFDALSNLGDVFILEPTGDYSKVWISQLEDRGKTVFLAAPRRVAYLRLYHDCGSKSDRNDALFLAAYGLENLNKSGSFIVPHAEELRMLYLRQAFLSKLSCAAAARLWQLLSYQWPEVCVTPSGKKPNTQRDYLRPSCYGLFEFIAGKKHRGSGRFQGRLNATVGSGLDPFSRFLASEICAIEHQMYLVEQDIEACLSAPEFAPYHLIFNAFGMGHLTRAAMLSRIYPVERFLGEDGKPIIEYVNGPKTKRTGGRTKRRRSEASFKLALGMGRVIYQSGDIQKERSGGPVYARTALYRHVKVQIVMKPRSALHSTAPYLKAHAQLYHSLDVSIPHKRRVMKTCSRIARDLFRELTGAI